MKIKIIVFSAIFLSALSVSKARTTNPYPIAVLRHGDLFILKGKNNWQQLTLLGDIQEICWLDEETICFSRNIKTGLPDQPNWRGLNTLQDLFTINKDGRSLKQFTFHHFAAEPSPDPLPGRALFTHRLGYREYETEIWETTRPPMRDRPLGIRGHLPDCSPDSRWTAAALNDSSGGIGLYRYPTSDSYRKLRGPYTRPRFSPGGFVLTYFNYESGKNEIWGYDVPDGDPRKILGVPEGQDDIIDFGWTQNGSGLILVMVDQQGKRNLFFFETERRILHKLSDCGDIDRATAWH